MMVATTTIRDLTTLTAMLFLLMMTTMEIQAAAETTSNGTTSTASEEEEEEELLPVQPIPVMTKMMGTCTYVNPWTPTGDGGTCMEFRGEGWTDESMKERCDVEQESALNLNACPIIPMDDSNVPLLFGGYCIKEADSINDAVEATVMMIESSSDCETTVMACETFVGGIFDRAEVCGTSTGSGTTEDDVVADDDDSNSESSAPVGVGPPEGISVGGGGASWGGGGGGSDGGSGFGGGGGQPPLSPPSRNTNTACDTGPNALTDALLSKVMNSTTTASDVDADHYSRVVHHTCIDNTGYEGKRCFYTYVPECATENSPLVYDIHGVTLCPLWNFETTGWIQKSIENCFVVVWPVGNLDPSLSAFSCFAMEGGYDVTDAANEYSNSEDANDTAIPGMVYETDDCCCFNFRGPTVPTSTFDDLTFLRNVATVVVNDVVPNRTNGKVTIDTKRIYFGGHSNGCTSGLSMAATNSDMVAAVCCHSPALISPFPSEYDAVPIFLVHGKEDGTVPYYGWFPGGPEEPRYNPGALQMNTLLGEVNGCTTSSDSSIDNNSTDLNNQHRVIQGSCNNDNAIVELLSLENSGHTPFLNADLFVGDKPDARITTYDTTQDAWEFCSRYSKEIEPVLELITGNVVNNTNVNNTNNASASSIASDEDADDEDDDTTNSTSTTTIMEEDQSNAANATSAATLLLSLTFLLTLLFVN